LVRRRCRAQLGVVEITHEHGPLCSFGLGDLIQIADPDALSNSAKQEIEMDKQLFNREVRLASASNFETFLTVRELSTPGHTVELKFETVFDGAKDPQARQIKAQFFINRNDLKSIELALSEASSDFTYLEART
jgi:hypothetical protein